VGVLLFEALAGRSPFRGDTPLALVEAISRGAIEPLRELCPDVDPAVVAVVERAMRQDPDERYASASEMAAALAAATETTDAAFVDEPTVATPAPTPTPTLTPTTAEVDSTRMMATAPPTRARRLTSRMRWLLAAAVVAVLLAAGIWSTRDSNNGARPFSNTPATSETPTGSIPAPLNRAIDDLDRAVQP
jgi:serine/threonine protein kinase